ncbi:MAG: SDR family oxidoreductase [Gammaproteobacteria bacterium]|nr:SDR family oxidoreductase [Gammaproteobacteria bacterium]NND55510.1 SDR family oxidoreductase [Gammaproteobacteria bacterium]
MNPPDNLFDLSGKVALINGGSRGIGAAIAKGFASYGAHVIVSSRHAESCAAVADGIVAEGFSAEGMACHGGNLDDIDKLFGNIREQHGKLDVLLNNAATNPYYGHILDTEPAAFDKTVEVNLRGYFYMSVAAAKLMKENGGGSIINTASVNAIQPGNFQGIYSITKAAVVNMTKSFAQECGEFGIRCNALLPGLTETQLASGLIDDADILQGVTRKTALGRHAQPEEMVGAALLLASDAGSYITGESIVVDGGLTTASAL